jgi:hypothetical protein
MLTPVVQVFWRCLELLVRRQNQLEMVLVFKVVKLLHKNLPHRTHQSNNRLQQILDYKGLVLLAIALIVIVSMDDSHLL